MSLPSATKKLKTAGEHDGVDATSEGGAIEGTDPTDAAATATAPAPDAPGAPDVAVANADVPDAILARILRRRGDPRLTQLNMRLPGAVAEYEFVDERSLANMNRRLSERFIAFLEGEPVEYRAVWLSDRCFLLRRNIRDHNPRYPWHISCTLQFSYDRPLIGFKILIDLVDVQTSPSVQPVAEGDSLLRILSKHGGISHFDFDARDGRSSFPASVPSLEAFVSKVPSYRRRPRRYDWEPPSDYCRSPTRFSFGGGRLSEEHKRVLAFRCHRSVELAVHFDVWSSGSGPDVLLEAIRLDVCPTRLSFTGLNDLSAYHLREPSNRTRASSHWRCLCWGWNSTLSAPRR
jgi:hypothetical protein